MPDTRSDAPRTPPAEAVKPTRTGAIPGPATPAAATPQPRRTDHNAEWDADDDGRPDGDPASVKDAGPLESLGRAVSSPVREASGDASVSDRPPRKP